MKAKHDSYLSELAEIVEGHFKRERPNESRRIILSRRANMIARCYQPTNDSYFEYGGRGIKVCDEWNDSSHAYLMWFCKELAKHACYYADVSEALQNLSVDRINPAKDYTPANCRLIKREINDYTTIQPARCLMFNGEWMPFWYAEKYVGWVRINNDKDRMSDYVRRIFKNRENGKSQIKQTPYMMTAQGLTRIKLGDFANAKNHAEICEAIIKTTNGYVFYDFTQNPLVINKSKECRCKCGKLVKFTYVERDGTKEWRVTCNCGLNALLVANRYIMSESEVEKFEKLPFKLFNRNIHFTAFKKSARESTKEQEQKRHFIAKIDSDYKQKHTEKQRQNNENCLNRKRVVLGLKPRKIKERGEPTPILELQTRKAIRTRLKRDNIDPQSELYTQARQRMTELLHIEKTRAKELNPAAFYANLKRYNDKYTKRKKGEDYVIKCKETALYNIHKNTPRGEARRAEQGYIYLNEFEGKNTSDLITDAEFKQQGRQMSETIAFCQSEFNSEARVKMLDSFKRALRRLQ